jgi:hypothetical protein
VAVAVMVIALLCVNGCKKSEKETQPTTATTASLQR